MRNFVPNDNSATQSLGTRLKRWGKAFIDKLVFIDANTGVEKEVNIADLATSAEITNKVKDVEEKLKGLDGKADANHTHTTSQISGLDTALSGKAAKSHTHSMSEVTGLTAALNGKATLSTGTADLNPGVTPLANGTIHLVYE